MRSFVLTTILACFLVLAWSAAIDQQLEDDNDRVVYDVPVDGEHARQARQFYGGYYGRPYGGFYGRPYYGGYYGRPYYTGYYGRPYYGGYYGGFYG